MYFHRSWIVATAVVSLLLSLPACAPRVPDAAEPATWLPEAKRIVAIGDLHGDFEAAREALQLAGATDAMDQWIGGDLVVVQTGDILDRGDGEKAIMALFRSLRSQARLAGGAVYVLNGNHELMNASMDFRYVTDGGFEAFSDSGSDAEPVMDDSVLAALDPKERDRAAAFRPGGPWARILAERNTTLVVGRTVFVHGGILPEHVEMGLEEINQSVRSWLRGEGPEPEWIRGERSPVWTRLYSDEPDQAACDTLSAVLSGLGVDRMVVGHTVQASGITSYCGGRVWCIDVGMASYYRGRPEVLEIQEGVVRSLR